jgi:hypothetical protein
MSDDQMFAETKSKLDDLEQRIAAARASVGAPAKFVAGAHQDWNEMVATHTELRRRLDNAKSSPGALDGISFDIDILRHSFERWAARVEHNYDQAAKKAGG